ncbi:MAG: cytochrome-c peroxidase [Saprospiraceae bacterium]|nr:cytochrome-c peroxidase [Saprospiraceae bacterium]
MKKYPVIYILFGLMLFSVVFNCKKECDEDISEEKYNLDFYPFSPPTISADNIPTVEGVKLGRMLFYEKMLSKDNSMSCASCHNQKNAFSDTTRFSIGVEGFPGKRQAMAVFNMAWNSNEFFWDGRAHLLRDQSLKPIQDKLEMNETLENVIAKLQASTTYCKQFQRAFGTKKITSELMSKAMEQFMNTIISNRSKYDDFLANKISLTNEEERGRFLFFTEYNPFFPLESGADCQHCHGGDNFENDRYLNNGIDTEEKIEDSGRQSVSNNADDKGRFKVPSLRNVELTFPYMHDGRFRTLEEVVDHYNLVKISSTLDASFQQQLAYGGLKLSDTDKKALVAFLKTLTDRKLTEDPRYSSPF